jgi:hypothetical protein
MGMGISKRMKRARELLASGKAKTKAEAARLTGLSKSALTIDPECRRLTAGPTRVQRALELMAEGVSMSEAAELVGVRPNSIYNYKSAQRKKETA